MEEDVCSADAISVTASNARNAAMKASAVNSILVPPIRRTVGTTSVRPVRRTFLLRVRLRLADDPAPARRID